MKNRDLSAHGWAIYYVMLRYSLAHIEAPTKPNARGEEESTIRLLAALRDEPAPIDHLGLIKVYPKSIDSLQAIVQFAGRLESAVEDESTFWLEIIGWCATHPAPGLPFTDTDNIPPVPMYPRALGQARLKRAYIALCLLHEDRIAFLQSIGPSGELAHCFRGQRVLHTQKFKQWRENLRIKLDLPPAELSRERSLPALLALNVVAKSVAAEMQGGPPEPGAPLVA